MLRKIAHLTAATPTWPLSLAPNPDRVHWSATLNRHVHTSALVQLREPDKRVKLLRQLRDSWIRHIVDAFICCIYKTQSVSLSQQLLVGLSSVPPLYSICQYIPLNGLLLIFVWRI